MREILWGIVATITFNIPLYSEKLVTRNSTNTDGSCFLNSTMQMLAHIKPFTDFLEENIKNYAEDSVARDVYGFIKKLQEKSNKKVPAEIVSKFRNAICNKSKAKSINDMKSGQHDADELMGYILSSIINDPKDLEEFKDNLFNAIYGKISENNKILGFINNFLNNIDIHSTDSLKEIFDDKIKISKKEQDLWEIKNEIDKKNSKEDILKKMFEKFIQEYNDNEKIKRLSTFLNENGLTELKKKLNNYKNYENKDPQFFEDAKRLQTIQKPNFTYNEMNKASLLINDFKIKTKDYPTMYALKDLFEYTGEKQNKQIICRDAFFNIQFDSFDNKQSFISAFTGLQIKSENENSFHVSYLISGEESFILFKKMPKILIFTLNRFKESDPEVLTKDTQSRKIFEKLTFEIEGKNPEIQTFNLIGMVIHSGSMTYENGKKAISSGHYWAIVKNYNDNKWYTYDDTTSKIEEKDISKVLKSGNDRSATAYILAYQKEEEIKKIYPKPQPPKIQHSKAKSPKPQTPKSKSPKASSPQITKVISSQISAQKKITPGPWNRGSAGGNNNCFLNSSMQALSHTSPLAKFLKEFKETKLCKQNSATDYVYNYFEELHDKTKNGTAASTDFRKKITHKKINNIKNETLITMAGGNQQDADEFIRAIIEKMITENPKIEDIFNLEITKLNQCFSINLTEKMAFKSYSLSNFSYNKEKYKTLPLSIVKNSNTIHPKEKKFSCLTTLDGCLDYYFSFPEQTDYDLTLSQKNRFTSYFRITKLPQILIIQLKRFIRSDENTTKLMEDISIPIKLKIKKNWLLSNNEKQQEITYDLFSVVFHTGTIDFGHYITWAKNPKNNEWYEYDDAKVISKEVPKNITNIKEQTTPYIIFYQISENSDDFINFNKENKNINEITCITNNIIFPKPLDPTEKEVKKTIKDLNKARAKEGKKQLPIPPIKAPEIQKSETILTSSKTSPKHPSPELSTKLFSTKITAKKPSLKPLPPIKIKLELNTDCFMSSVIQVLRHTKPFTDFLEENNKDFVDSKKGGLIQYKTYRLFKALEGIEIKGDTIYNPEKDAIKKFREFITSNPIIKNNKLQKLQSGIHDSGEFFSNFLSEFNTNNPYARDTEKLSLLHSIFGIKTITFYKTEVILKNNTTFERINFERSKNETENVLLTIPAEKKTSESKLTDYLERYFKIDQTDVDPKENIQTMKTSHTYISKLPEILTIQLIRSKIDPIFIPLSFTFNKKWLIPIKEFTHQDVTYNLFSLIYIKEKKGQKHFITLAKDNGKWYEYDDEKIKEISPQNSLQNTLKKDNKQKNYPYMLFYELDKNSKTFVEEFNYTQIETTQDSLQTALALLKAKLLSLAQSLKS